MPFSLESHSFKQLAENLIERLHMPDRDYINIAHSFDRETISRYFLEEKKNFFNFEHFRKFRYTELKQAFYAHLIFNLKHFKGNDIIHMKYPK